MLTFLETDPATLFQRLKTVFELHAGRTLYPAQIENLLLKTLAYVDSERRIATQYAAEQNLVAYATGPHLDALGANLETPRLQPSKARCAVAFALAAPAPQGLTIPAGTRIKTPDGKFTFETLVPADFYAGATTAQPVQAQCIETGAQANGIPAAQINTLAPAMEGVTASNTSTPTGGGDLETDEAYRTRLLLAPARFGGGTADGYRLAALGASPEVADALAVQGAQPGDVQVYILAKDPEASDLGDLCLAVQARLNAPDIALIGDQIHVDPATAVSYTIAADLTLAPGHDRDLTRDRAAALARAFADAHAARLGIDVTPTQILLALAPLADAIYTINLRQPAATIALQANEWPHLASIEFNVATVQ